MTWYLNLKLGTHKSEGPNKNVQFNINLGCFKDFMKVLLPNVALFDSEQFLEEIIKYSKDNGTFQNNNPVLQQISKETITQLDVFIKQSFECIAATTSDKKLQVKNSLENIPSRIIEIIINCFEMTVNKQPTTMILAKANCQGIQIAP